MENSDGAMDLHEVSCLDAQLGKGESEDTSEDEENCLLKTRMHVLAG